MPDQIHSEETEQGSARSKRTSRDDRAGGPAGQALQLQRLAGNAAVTRLLSGAASLPVQRDKTKADDEEVEKDEEG